MAKKTTKKTEKTFEESFKEVEEMVRQVEGGNLTIDAYMEVYEKGVPALKRCYQALHQAEKKIEKLKKEFEGGFSTEDFEYQEQ